MLHHRLPETFAWITMFVALTQLLGGHSHSRDHSAAAIAQLSHMLK